MKLPLDPFDQRAQLGRLLFCDLAAVDFSGQVWGRKSGAQMRSAAPFSTAAIACSFVMIIVSGCDDG